MDLCAVGDQFEDGSSRVVASLDDDRLDVV
jgi:hypothetical protein